MKWHTRVLDWIAGHWWIVVVAAFIGVILGLWAFQGQGQGQGDSLKEWGSKPASEFTKGEVVLLVFFLAWFGGRSK